MAIWGVRAGRYGEWEDFATENGCAVIGWDDVPDLRAVESREALIGALAGIFREESEGTRRNYESQLWAFAKRISVDDLVALPKKTSGTIAFGKVSGAYRYVAEAPPGAKHQLPVSWFPAEVPRQRIDQDLLFSLGSAMTVFQVSRNNAEARLRALIAGRPVERPASSQIDETTTQDRIDIEERARDEILQRISHKFRGHEFERLVETVLRAQGFSTERAPEGADGGVDIVAGKGSLGLEAPRICVQVKSSDDPADVSVLREMQGVLTTFGADLGLIVSWGGFKRSVLTESRRHFFRIRLWHASDVLTAVLENYERLPEDIQKDLPLKRIWTMVGDGD